MNARTGTAGNGSLATDTSGPGSSSDREATRSGSAVRSHDGAGSSSTSTTGSLGRFTTGVGSGVSKLSEGIAARGSLGAAGSNVIVGCDVSAYRPGGSGSGVSSGPFGNGVTSSHK
ncbi:MAG: hypothetical protein AAGJ97_14880, partial [Planctomycetota bacterium]